MKFIRRWTRRGQHVVDADIQIDDRRAKIYVGSIGFSADQTISLNDSSILVIVGPNNAGKSSVLGAVYKVIDA